MTLESKVICVRELPAGEPIGYGAKFITQKPMRVGVVAMGYADGYPRQAPTGTPVLVAGQRSQLIGRVSMDMLCIDLTDVPQAGLGSTVELWGKNILASDVAIAAGHHSLPDLLQPAPGATALFRGPDRCCGVKVL
jgi:alanine racemase